jgi:hypothetical protein
MVHAVFSPNLAFSVHFMSQAHMSWGGGAAAAASTAQKAADEQLQRTAAEEARVARSLAYKQARSADVATPTHEYFYVLPQETDQNWHIVHQLRLDSDADAASKVKAAIIAEFSSIPPDAVEVAAVDVDMFNNAFRFSHNDKEKYICRSKKFSGHEWRLENKRFLVRVASSPHSQLILQRLASLNPSDQPLCVKNVSQLATQPVAWQGSKYFGQQSPYGKDFGKYETSAKKGVTALDANSSDITLSLCSPLVFAVQGSLAHAPSSAVDLSALGTAFLDIIKVIAAPAGLSLTCRHASSYPSFSPTFAARHMERAHHLHQLLLPQFHVVSHAKLLRPLP